jgi:hypothetical protein
MSEGPATISVKDLGKHLGKVAVLYRKDTNTPARIVSLDTVNMRIIYDILGGPDKGKRMSSKYDDTQTAKIYDAENEVLAFLAT